jgi:hypothetical protein
LCSERSVMDDALDMPAPAPTPTGCRFTVQTGDDDDVVVRVIGDLDPPSAHVLLELVESAIGSPGTSRGIEVDLRRLRACSNSGVRALTACVALGARLRDGLHFRVGIASDGSDAAPKSARMRA